MSRLPRTVLLDLAAACCGSAVSAATASARVTATIEPGHRLVVDGTILHDEILVSTGGPVLVVKDKDRVNAQAGCSENTIGQALCPADDVSSIEIDGHAADDSLTTASNIGIPITIVGGSGDDTINAGGHHEGNSQFGDSGDDTITGGGADDWTSGGDGDDTLNGGPEADFIQGNAGVDTLRGGQGDDLLRGGAGADRLIGDTEVDIADYSDHDAAVTARSGPSTGNGNSDDGTGDTLDATTEGAGGTNLDDTLIGNDGANVLQGSLGDDLLDGRGGADVLKPGPGDDVVHGGPGIDTASYAGLTSPATVVLGGQNDSGPAFSHATIDSEVENAEGGLRDDTLIGTAGANRFTGGRGFDTVSYSARTAALTVDADGVADDGAGIGGATPENDNVGADVEGITGGSGPDTLTATSSGNGGILVGSAFGTVQVLSRLDGGPGADQLTGSDGPDQILGGSGTDTLAARGDNDVTGTNGDNEVDNTDCGLGSADFARLDSIDSQVNCEITFLTFP